MPNQLESTLWIIISGIHHKKIAYRQARAYVENGKAIANENVNEADIKNTEIIRSFATASTATNLSLVTIQRNCCLNTC